MNDWENDDFDILQALYIIYKKIMTTPFPYLLFNLLKQSYISSVKSCKCLNKIIS